MSHSCPKCAAQIKVPPFNYSLQCKSCGAYLLAAFGGFTWKSGFIGPALGSIPFLFDNLMVGLVVCAGISLLLMAIFWNQSIARLDMEVHGNEDK